MSELENIENSQEVEVIPTDNSTEEVQENVEQATSDNELAEQERLEQLCLPVTAGTVVETQWTTSTSVTVAIARFIPCQGNI